MQEKKATRKNDAKAIKMEGDKQFKLLTGGPSSGGMIILLLPPGLMSRIPSSNPA